MSDQRLISIQIYLSDRPRYTKYSRAKKIVGSEKVALCWLNMMLIVLNSLLSHGIFT
ncbi:MAG: hypothetical protein AAGF83_16190 [Cyanobacteria bacterium P01_G01_bin.67]